jgi:tRNA nucleotidyltransferase (CCA-adding enzyme)
MGGRSADRHGFFASSVADVIVVARNFPVLDRAIQSLPGLTLPFPRAPELVRLVDVVTGLGGRPIAVGGAVRDHLLGAPPKDIDVEIYDVTLEVLEAALAQHFAVHAVGRSFGVLKVDVAHDDDPAQKTTFDVALPRRESKSGQGHKGFIVESDPHLTFTEAAARRDFTVNAIGVDLVTGALLDPHGGARDLANGVLRHVSTAFDEDPLRVLRAAQFAARLGLALHDDTRDRCRALQHELPTLPVERVLQEMKKLLVQGVWPSVGLHVLRTTGALDALFPELVALIGCPQEAEWHPEGDVWIHTLMVVDEAAQIARSEKLNDDDTLVLTLAALAHDLGKPATTAFIDGRVRSRDHESQGEAPTRTFLARMGAWPALVDVVVALVRDHLKPFQLFKEQAGDGAIRRLALRVNIQHLVRVARADAWGRTTPDALVHDDESGEWLLAQAERLRVEAGAPKPILLGRHLLTHGLRPGPQMGTLLKDAFEAQLEGAFVDESGAIAWLAARLAAGAA